ncbi:MAG: DUF3795 domain-containing protein [Planctomycetota bacterium]
MDEIIGYCGLNCCTCPIYVATRETDDEKRHKMRTEIAEQIRKHYGTKYKPEQITGCDGCKTQGGRLFAGSNNCHIRKCARPKGIENCAHCSEYACDKLKEFFVKYPDAKTRLDVIRSAL